MSALRVAVSQLALVPEHTVESFLRHLECQVALAAADGAELVVFPELASTGLLAGVTDHEVTRETVTSDYWTYLPRLTDTIVEGFQSLAARHAVTILGGSHNRIADDGSLRNTAYLVQPDGAVQTQDKIHLTPQEHALGTRGGDSLLVTRVGPFTAGLLICADIQFPELSRYLAANGVDLILCPSLTWNRRGVHRVRTGCQARAMENQLYVVMSPLVGSNGLPHDAPMHAVGRAIVTAPVDKTVGLDDGVLAELDTTAEALLFADLDRDLLMASRANPETPGLGLQRPDLYAKLRADLD